MFNSVIQATTIIIMFFTTAFEFFLHTIQFSIQKPDQKILGQILGQKLSDYVDNRPIQRFISVHTM